MQTKGLKWMMIMNQTQNYEPVPRTGLGLDGINQHGVIINTTNNISLENGLTRSENHGWKYFVITYLLYDCLFDAWTPHGKFIYYILLWLLLQLANNGPRQTFGRAIP